MKSKLLVLFCLLQCLIPGLALAEIPAQASLQGKYQSLLKVLSCPQDEDEYGEFEESGYYDETEYCGQSAPAGYWVWLAPDWYIWELKGTAQAPAQELAPEVRASFKGKYRGLIQSLECPAELAADKALYGELADAGHYKAVNYCGQNIPEGYWVWVAPRWYIWSVKDLQAAGYESLSQSVKLSEQTLELQIEFLPAHRAWAQTSLKQVAAALQKMEAMTGLPYPGVNPYVIEERPNLELLGLAGPDGMLLASPPRGTPWTFLHEVVHIWNAGVQPAWLREGQADYLSFLMMHELKFPFIKDETYASYIADWKQIMGEPEDLPLDQHYDDMPQGKAMAWWAMAHELFGRDFTVNLFVNSIAKGELSTSELAAFLRKVSKKDPAPLLDGWIRKGAYQVRQSQDFGPVKAALPEAWQ